MKLPSPSATVALFAAILAVSFSPTLLQETSDVCGPLDVLFVVDHSGSISDNDDGLSPNWSYIIDLMKSVVSSVYTVNSAVRFATVSFGNQASIEFTFDQYSSVTDTVRAVDAIVNSGGNTNTTGAIRLSRTAVFGSTANRPQAPDVCVLITDGVPSLRYGGDQLMAEVGQLKQLGVRVIGVGVTTAVNTSLMLEVVTNPATDYFDVLQFSQLPSILNNLTTCITGSSSTTTTTVRSTPSRPTTTTTTTTSSTSSTTSTTTTSTVPTTTTTTSTSTTTTPTSTVTTPTFPTSTSTSTSTTTSTVPTTTTSTSTSTSTTTTPIPTTTTTTTTATPSTSTSTSTTTSTSISTSTVPTTTSTSTTTTPTSTSTSTSTTTSTVPTTTTSTSTSTSTTTTPIPTSTTTTTTTPSTSTSTTTPTSTTTSTSTSTTSTTVPTTSSSTSTSTTLTTTPTTTTSAATTLTPTTSTTTTTTTSSTTTRASFTATTTATLPPAFCRNGFDLVILLDASGGGGSTPQQFTAVKNFLTDLISVLNVNTGSVRVGMIQFADTVRLLFNLQSFVTNSSGLIAEIQQSATLVGGGTNTAAAIQYARQNMFGSSVGGRTTFPDIILLVTYGSSQSVTQTENQAYLARASGIVITAVTIGSATLFDSEINDVVSYPSSATRLAVQTFNQLDAVLRNSTVSLLCNNGDDCSSGPCTGSAACVDTIGSYKCICPSTFSGINCAQTCVRPADIVFVVDVSSAFAQYVSAYTAFLRNVLTQLNVNSRVGLLTFASNPTVVFQLTDFPSPLEAARTLNIWPLASTGIRGNTASAISTAFNSMLLPFNRTNVDRFLVVLTNGWTNNDAFATAAASQARNAGINVITVGIPTTSTPTVNQLILNLMASDPISTTVLIASSSTTIDSDSATTSALLGLLCQNSGYGCDARPCRNGGTCTNRPGANYVCSCPIQYTGSTCQSSCSSLIDLVYVVDVSTAARLERFPFFLNFIHGINAQLQIDPNKTRVGLITYSSEVSETFYLRDYQTARDVYFATNLAAYVGGPAILSSAFRTLYQRMFTSEFGARSNAQHIAIVITSGIADADASQVVAEDVIVNNNGIQVIIVGVGLDINIRQLATLASYPPSLNLLISGYANGLQGYVNNVLSATCFTNFCALSPCTNGATCSNKVGYYWCYCSPWYGGRQCERYCNKTLDVAIVLDMSNGMETSEVMLALVYDLVAGLPVGLNMVRVALVTYTDSVTINFNFTTFTTTEQVLNALTFSYPPGGTNSAAALQTLYQTVFTPAAGARSNARRIAVFVTSGYSDDPSATQVEAANARANGITIYGVAYDTPSDFLGEVIGIDSSQSPYQLSSNYDPLAAQPVADNILNDICS